MEINRWVYTILDPVATVILSNENAAPVKWTDNWMRVWQCCIIGKFSFKSQQNASQTQKAQKSSER